MARNKTARPLVAALKKERADHTLAFGGLGGKEHRLPRAAKLDPNDPGYHRKVGQRLTALLSAYGINPQEPDGGWRLAAALAIEFLPNFAAVLPRVETRVPTRGEVLASRIAPFLAAQASAGDHGTSGRPQEMAPSIRRLQALMAEEVGAWNEVYPDRPEREPTVAAITKGLQRFCEDNTALKANLPGQDAVKLSKIDAAVLTSVAHYNAVIEAAKSLTQGEAL